MYLLRSRPNRTIVFLDGNNNNRSVLGNIVDKNVSFCFGVRFAFDHCTLTRYVMKLITPTEQRVVGQWCS